MAEETLVVGIDFDGCSNTEAAREKLKTFIVDFVQENPDYKKLIVCIASLRQSVWLDFVGAAQSKDGFFETCSILGTDFFEVLKASVGASIEVFFEPILTYDVYHNLLPGTTFEAMQDVDYQTCLEDKEESYLSGRDINNKPVQMFSWTGSRFGLSVDVIDNWSMANVSKQDICYMLMHHIARYLGDGEFTFLLIDDLASMLFELECFFKENADVVPSTCSFRGIQFDHQNNAFPPSSMVTDCIQGYGKIDVDFQTNMRAIREQSLNLERKAEYPAHYAAGLVALANKPAMDEGVSPLRQMSVFDVAFAQQVRFPTESSGSKSEGWMGLF